MKRGGRAGYRARAAERRCKGGHDAVAVDEAPADGPSPWTTHCAVATARACAAEDATDHDRGHGQSRVMVVAAASTTAFDVAVALSVAADAVTTMAGCNHVGHDEAHAVALAGRGPGCRCRLLLIVIHC